MTVIDEILAANKRFAARVMSDPLLKAPSRAVAVLTCMDTQIAVEQALGIGAADAHIIRNAGGIASKDAIRSLIVSHHFFGAKEVMVINHANCIGAITKSDEAMREELAQKTRKDASFPQHFHGFEDAASNVRLQISRITNHPWIPTSVVVRGFLFEEDTGRLLEVFPISEPA